MSNIQHYLPAPIACGMLGAFAGLLAGGCTQCFPAWVGAATGGGIGCIICLVEVLMPPKALPIAKPITIDPVIIQNIYITYEASGQPKGIPDPQKLIL